MGLILRQQKWERETGRLGKRERERGQSAEKCDHSLEDGRSNNIGRGNERAGQSKQSSTEGYRV